MDVIATPILGSLGLALTHSIWQGFLAALVVIGFRKLTKGTSPSLQYSFQILMLFACFAAFLVTFGLIQFSGGSAAELTFIKSQTAGVGQSAGAPTVAGTTQTQFFNLQTWLSRNAHVLGLLWCIGFTLLAARYLINFTLTQQLRRTGLSSVPVKWEHRFKTLLLNAGLTKNIEIFVSSRVRGPLTLGFFKPIVLVPASFFTGLPCEQIEAVLLHEIAHIRRHDYLINLAQTAIKTVFFFHPAIHYISRKIDEDREHACDDFSVIHTSDPHSLAKALAALRLTHSAQGFAMAANGKNAPLLARLKRLTASPETTKPQGSLVIPALTVLMASVIYFSAAPMTDAHPTDEADSYEHPDARKDNYSFETIVKDGKSVTVKIGEDGRRWMKTRNGWFDVDNDAYAMQALKGQAPMPPTPPTPPHVDFKKYGWENGGMDKAQEKAFEKKMAQFEIDMEYFEADMERFSKEMAEFYGKNIDHEKITRQVERAMERAEAQHEREMDRAEAARDRAEEERERAAEQRERELERAEDARERAAERREEAEERRIEAEERRIEAQERRDEARERAHERRAKHQAFKDELIPMLMADGLISSPDDKIKITYPGNKLTVNGKKAESEKYCKLWDKYDIRKSEQSYIKISPKSYETKFKSKDGKSTHHETYGEFKHDKSEKSKPWKEGHNVIKFIKPVNGAKITGRFHETDSNWPHLHQGVDLAISPGTPVFASAQGYVDMVTTDPEWGKRVMITHDDGYQTVYANLGDFLVTQGQSVKAGDTIGKVGNSAANSSGPHLHFEIKRHNERVNPEDIIAKLS